jgi:hypothetical protein
LFVLSVWFTVLNCFHITIIYSQIYHLNSDFYDLRLETPDDYDEVSACHDMKRKRSNNIPPRFQRLQKEKQEASKKVPV